MEVVLQKDHVLAVCKMGQGTACCSYLVAGGDGFGCAKVMSDVKPIVDRRRAAKTMNAMGDNCSGPPDFKEVK